MPDSYLPVSEMIHVAMVHFKSRSFSLSKSLSEINLNQMTVNSLFSCLTGSTTIIFAFAISEERSNLQ